jgi:hypothetical protein
MRCDSSRIRQPALSRSPNRSGTQARTAPVALPGNQPERTRPKRSDPLALSGKVLFSGLCERPPHTALRWGITLVAQTIGHLRCRQPLIEQLLGRGQHRCGQHRRPAPLARFVEPFRSLFAVALHRASGAKTEAVPVAHPVAVALKTTSTGIWSGSGRCVSIRCTCRRTDPHPLRPDRRWRGLVGVARRDGAAPGRRNCLPFRLRRSPSGFPDHPVEAAPSSSRPRPTAWSHAPTSHFPSNDCPPLRHEPSTSAMPSGRLPNFGWRAHPRLVSASRYRWRGSGTEVILSSGPAHHTASQHVLCSPADTSPLQTDGEGIPWDSGCGYISRRCTH